MKLLFIILPFLVFSQKKIIVKLEFEIIDTTKFLNDTIYNCKEQKKIRVTKDSIYIYGKNQYFKLKKQNGNQRKQNK